MTGTWWDDVAQAIGWLVLAGLVLTGALYLVAMVLGEVLLRVGRCPACRRVMQEGRRCASCGVMAVGR